MMTDNYICGDLCANCVHKKVCTYKTAHDKLMDEAKHLASVYPVPFGLVVTCSEYVEASSNKLPTNILRANFGE